MSDERKAREFWIVDFDSGKRQVSERLITHDSAFFGPSDSIKLPRIIAIRHVIEYSAYTDLLAQANKLEEAILKEAEITGKSGMCYGMAKRAALDFAEFKERQGMV